MFPYKAKLFQDRSAALITFTGRILDGFMEDSPLSESKNENLHHVFAVTDFTPVQIFSEVLCTLPSVQCKMLLVEYKEEFSYMLDRTLIKRYDYTQNLIELLCK